MAAQKNQLDGPTMADRLVVNDSSKQIISGQNSAINAYQWLHNKCKQVASEFYYKSN